MDEDGVGMKTRTAVYVGALQLSSAIILATAFLSADAWAGRVSPKPGPTTAQTPPAPHGSGEYRLVFPAGYDVPVKQKEAGRDSSRNSKFDNFVARLNEAGAEGYRLTSFVYKGSAGSGLPVGLLRRTGASYEYRWLFAEAAHRDIREVTNGFNDKYAELSKQGFRLADFTEFENYCSILPGDTSEPGPLPEECNDAYVFLFEREKGVARPARHHTLAALSGGSEAAFLREVRQILADDLIPKYALPVYRVWFEPAGMRDARWGGGTDVEVVSEAADAGSWRRSTFKKKVNELAQRGYRAATLDWGLALMYRARGVGAAARYSYVWVKADGGLERQLAKLQASGAIYLKTYQKEDHLIFEQRAVDNGRRYEHKALKFKFDTTRDAPGAHVRVELAPPSRETLRALERFVGEGFAVRDLFLSGDRIGAILERPL
jgi:hypothetical protein